MGSANVLLRLFVVGQTLSALSVQEATGWTAQDLQPDLVDAGNFLFSGT